MAESERSQVKLTPKQLAAVEALMLAPSIQEAAARAGVPESTLRRWRAQPDFQAALKAASYELWQGLTNRLQASTEKAVATLESICDGGDKDTARVSAARWILEFAFKAREALIVSELDDIKEKLDAVEEAEE